MKRLYIISLLLVLNDLLGRRARRIEGTLTAQLYLPLLRARRDAIAVFVARPTDNRKPLAQRLTEAATRQAAHARAIRLQLDAIVDDDAFAAPVREAAHRVRGGLFPPGAPSRPSHQDRAALAEAFGPVVERLAGDLALLTMPSGGTMGERVASWLGESAQIDALLSDSVDGATAAVVDAQARQLAARARAALRHMRQTLADEREVNPALPERLDALVFGRFDRLEAAARRRTGKDATAPVPAEPVVEPA